MTCVYIKRKKNSAQVSTQPNEKKHQRHNKRIMSQHNFLHFPIYYFYNKLQFSFKLREPLSYYAKNGKHNLDDYNRNSI